MKRSILYCLAWAVACAPALWAQQQGGGATGGQQPSAPGGSTPGQSTGRQPSAGTQKNPPGVIIQGKDSVGQRPVFLSGKVVLEDGSPPPGLAEIVRICGGRTYPEANADSRGNFSFEVGGDRRLATADAGVWARGTPGRQVGQPNRRAGARGANSAQVNLAGCEIHARLPGYRSEGVGLGHRSVFDNPNIGTIVLHRLDGVVGSAVSVTSLAAPKNARKAFENGLREMRKKKRNPGKAKTELEKAVAAYPEYASAWSALGELRLSLEDLEGAQEAFEKALQADPKYLSPYQPLVRIHLLAERWEPAAKLAGQALRLNPHMTAVRYFQALSYLNTGNAAEAEKAARAVQESRDAQEFPQTHRILGMIQAEQGNFTPAAQEYRSYLALQSDGPFAEELKTRLSEWEALGVIEKASAGPAEAVTAVKD